MVVTANPKVTIRSITISTVALSFMKLPFLATGLAFFLDLIFAMELV